MGIVQRDFIDRLSTSIFAGPITSVLKFEKVDIHACPELLVFTIKTHRFPSP